MKEVIVLSLGGSLIVPEKLDAQWIDRFKGVIKSLTKYYKFVIVCGGGYIAREYITILKTEKKTKKEQSLAGIEVTRMNAKIMMEIFDDFANKELPKDMKHVKYFLDKHDIVFTGSLRYAPNQTSDGAAARLAAYFKSRFINVTNVDGLYTHNPVKNKSAKFIREISWENFEKMALALKYKPGQHFVLDQSASRLIKKHKIITYILGRDLKNLKNLLAGKVFIGTTIKG